MNGVASTWKATFHRGANVFTCGLAKIGPHLFLFPSPPQQVCKESDRLRRYKVALTDIALIGIVVVSIAGVTYQLLQ